MADSSVPHRTDIRPGSRLRTKANRTEALPKSGHSGLHSSPRTGTWDRASARFGREATSGTTIPRMLQATSGLASDARDFEFAFPPLLLPDPAPSRPLRPRAHTHACARCPRAPGHTWPAAGAGGGRGSGVRPAGGRRRSGSAPRGPALPSPGPCRPGPARPPVHTAFSGCIPLVLPVPDPAPQPWGAQPVRYCQLSSVSTYLLSPSLLFCAQGPASQPCSLLPSPSDLTLTTSRVPPRAQRPPQPPCSQALRWSHVTSASRPRPLARDPWPRALRPEPATANPTLFPGGPASYAHLTSVRPWAGN